MIKFKRTDSGYYETQTDHGTIRIRYVLSENRRGGQSRIVGWLIDWGTFPKTTKGTNRWTHLADAKDHVRLVVARTLQEAQIK